MAQPDTEVGRLALEKGLITAPQLEDARREADARPGPGVRLVDVLLDKGYLCSADVAELQREAEAPARAGDGLDPEAPSEVAAAAKFADSRFGKYVIVKLLGTGGMGAVYRAWDADLHRMVALKFLTSGREDDLARFVREARTVARLSHPNIARVYDAGSTNGRHYIAMELVDGVTLDNLPEAVRRGDPRTMLRIFRDIALAVDYAHRQGIVHRDLKPQNIMVDEHSLPHVMDFGLARPVETGAAPGKAPITMAGTVIGTPNYVPPEQARGDSSQIDPRTDVYALGATMYAVFTGRPPFDGSTPIDILLKVLQEEPVPPGKVAPLNPDIDTVILKAMRKEKHARYPNLRELADDLERIIQGEPILARRPTFGERARKFAKAHPVLSAWTAALVLYAAGSGVIALALSARRPPPEDPHGMGRILADADRAARTGERLMAGSPAEALRLLRRAEADYTMAAERPGTCAEALRGRARVRYLLGNHPAAAADATEALSLRPGWPEARLLKARVRIDQAWRRAAAASFVDRALRWHDPYYLADAAIDLNHLLATDPDWEGTPEASALLALARGDADQALSSFDALSTPDSPWFATLAAAAAGRWEEVARRAPECSARRPADAALLSGLADSILRSADPLEVLTNIAAAHPPDEFLRAVLTEAVRLQRHE